MIIVYVCMYIYIYTHVYIHIYTHICIYIYIYTHTYINAYMYMQRAQAWTHLPGPADGCGPQISTGWQYVVSIKISKNT